MISQNLDSTCLRGKPPSRAISLEAQDIYIRTIRFVLILPMSTSKALTGQYTYFWECCNCRTHVSSAQTPYCPEYECAHRQCNNCAMEQVKCYAGRVSSPFRHAVATPVLAFPQELSSSSVNNISEMAVHDKDKDMRNIPSSVLGSRNHKKVPYLPW